LVLSETNFSGASFATERLTEAARRGQDFDMLNEAQNVTAHLKALRDDIMRTPQQSRTPSAAGSEAGCIGEHGDSSAEKSKPLTTEQESLDKDMFPVLLRMCVPGPVTQMYTEAAKLDPSLGSYCQLYLFIVARAPTTPMEVILRAQKKQEKCRLVITLRFVQLDKLSNC
jgi:hypothetical protein